MHIMGKVIYMLGITPFLWVSSLIVVSLSIESDVKLKETGNVVCLLMRSYLGIIVG